MARPAADTQTAGQQKQQQQQQCSSSKPTLVNSGCVGVYDNFSNYAFGAEGERGVAPSAPPLALPAELITVQVYCHLGWDKQVQLAANV